jgi:hypothetical protein
VRHIAILPVLALGACASPQQPAHQSLASLGAGYGGKSFDPADLVAHGGGTGVAMTRDVDAGLVVRPDTLLMDVRITDEGAGATQALAQAQAAGAELQTRLQAATAGAAALVWCGTQVTPRETSSTPAATAETFRVTLEGRVEIALAADLDYWKRSALVGALAELSAGLQRARAAKGGGRGVSLDSMRVAVKSPESYRGKLTELWVQRSRAFATAAQAHQAPLYLLDCTPPGDIRQRQQSLEEIALSLAVSCRLGSLKSPAPAAP